MSALAAAWVALVDWALARALLACLWLVRLAPRLGSRRPFRCRYRLGGGGAIVVAT